VKRDELRRDEVRLGGRVGAVAAAAAWVVLSCSLSAGTVTVGVEDWGLGGAVKGGMWVPLHVELTSKGKDFEGLLTVTADGGQRVLPLFVKPIALVRDTRTRHWIYVRAPYTEFRRQRYTFTWQVLDARGREMHRSRWKRPKVLPGRDSMVAVMRTANVARAGLGALTDQNSDVRVHALFISPQMAPDRALGYESADAVVWLNPNPSALATVSQRDAIVNYVRQGGHLVLAAGAGWQALKEPFLADLLPATPTGSRLATSLPPLEIYGTIPADRTSIILMGLRNARGRVLMSHGGSPIVVRGTAGLGRVTLIAFNPTTSPFADLKHRARFWSMALDVDTTRRRQTDVGTPRPASGPLIRSLNDFPGFKPINFVFVAIFLVAYVVLIGPVDYFVLKRLKKLHWTWVTFPAIAVVSSVMAFYFLSSGRVVGLWTNSVSIVDCSLDGGEMSGTTYMTMLSPKQTRYTVDLDGATGGSLVPREFETETGGGTWRLGQTTCQVIGAGERIEGLLVRIWDAQTFQASWRADPCDLPEVDLTGQGARLTGTIKNTTGDFMEDAVILFAGRVGVLGTIQAGRSINVGGVRWRSLADYAKDLTPGEFRPYDQWGGGWGQWQEMASKREGAEPAARWLSLFGGVAPTGGQPRFQRVISRQERYSSVVFDLPARLQLAGLDDADRAVVMYSVSRSPVAIRLVARRPRTWDCTVVRLRVPVTQR